MTPGGSDHRWAIRSYLLLIAALVAFLDRLAKREIVKNVPLYDSLPIVRGFFDLTHTQNFQAAFGLPVSMGLLNVFGVIVVIVILTVLWRTSYSLSSIAIGLSLILGGAIGNLCDRIFRGYVVDYLDFSVLGHHWPAFNVADSMIFIGAVLVADENVFDRSGERVRSDS